MIWKNLRAWAALCTLLVVIWFSSASAADWKEDAKIQKIFEGAGVNGTFVLYDVTAEVWVGWVQKEDLVYPFALNMDIIKESDASKRQVLGKASPKALGII